MGPPFDLLRAIQAVTSTPGHGCTRLAYTCYEDEAHDVLWEALARPGLVRMEDAAGNLFVVPADAVRDGADVVLIGSHLDTVIQGGWLDGALGVAVAAHVVDRLAGTAGRPVGLVVFRDEEGVRFSTGLFGSKVFAGLCTSEDLDRRDDGGVRLRDVVRDAPGCLTYRLPVRPAAYLECHIEQGMRLIERDRRVAVVTGMVGIRRFEVTGVGIANHAGTTEMHRRVDALLPVAALVARLPALVDDLPETVITCGRIAAAPGAPNIVPGLATAIVEIRAPDVATLDVVEQRLRRAVAEAQPPGAGMRPAAVHLREITNVAPVTTHPTLNAHLAAVLNGRRMPFEQLHSMAGHDAQHAAQICPAGMFFIPSLGGISHSPDEDSAEEDIALAADVMLAWAERCRA